MPEKGLKSEDSQKVYLLSTIKSFEYAVNGIKGKDFEENDEE